MASADSIFLAGEEKAIDPERSVANESNASACCEAVVLVVTDGEAVSHARDEAKRKVAMGFGCRDAAALRTAERRRVGTPARTKR